MSQVCGSGAHLRQKWRKPPQVCYHASHRDRKGLKKVAVGVEELGRGVQVLVGQRFKCFNGAFLGTVEKLFSLIIRWLRSTAVRGDSRSGWAGRRSFADAQDDKGALRMTRG